MTVFNLIWGPRMCQMPHNHGIWAIIGIYTGREDNIFWRRPAGVPGGRIEAAGAKALSEREAVPLGREIIHPVINPIKRLTGRFTCTGATFSPYPRANGTPNVLWKSLTMSRRRSRYSRSPTACTHRRECGTAGCMTSPSRGRAPRAAHRDVRHLGHLG
jgi:hypothetical protein